MVIKIHKKDVKFKSLTDLTKTEFIKVLFSSVKFAKENPKVNLENIVFYALEKLYNEEKDNNIKQT